MNSSPHAAIVRPFEQWTPEIADDVFLAPGTVIIGDVTLHDGVGIWYNTVIRGDINRIEIGTRTNVQDGCVLHTGHRPDHPLLIGANVTIGHSVCVHGCTIEDECLIGIGANVLNGAVVHSPSYVAAGALVPPNMVVPSGVVVAGVPAKVIRDLKESELADLIPSAERYYTYARQHQEVLG